MELWKTALDGRLVADRIPRILWLSLHIQEVVHQLNGSSMKQQHNTQCILLFDLGYLMVSQQNLKWIWCFGIVCIIYHCWHISLVGRPKQRDILADFRIVSSYNWCTWKEFTFNFNSFYTQGLRALRCD